MNIVTTLIFVLLCITPINCAANQFYPVLRVIDGDTFIVQIAGVTDYVRIIGVDTPETKDPRKPVQCFGPEASAKAKELLLGKKIRLETDPTQQVRGKYGRLIRHVFLDNGTNFGLWMIANGFAREYTYGNKPYRYQTQYRQAQQQAKANKFGLWGACQKTVTPNKTWHTSSHSRAKYYYCDSDNAWKKLSKKYLRSFPSLEALLKKFPQRSPNKSPCQ